MTSAGRGGEGGMAVGRAAMGRSVVARAGGASATWCVPHAQSWVRRPGSVSGRALGRHDAPGDAVRCAVAAEW